MTEIIVTTRDGAERAITLKRGRSLMEEIRDAGIDELLAICGGSCSCATCHVYIDPAFEGVLSPPSALEREMLDFSDHGAENSRLACQIRMDDAVDGLRVRIAPED